MFERIRETTWTVIGLTLVAYAGAIVFVNAVLFQGRTSEALGALYVAAGHLLDGALVGGLFDLAVVGVAIFGVGRLRASDVGWRRREVWSALLVTVVFWLVLQGVVAIIAAIDGGVRLHEAWKQPGPGAVVGPLLGQLLGNALVEETVFRGFLLPQLYVKAGRRFRRGAALMIAVVSSTLLFAVTHVPNLILVKHFTTADLFMFLGLLVFLGLLLAAIFIITQNLFIAVGLHALGNTPAALVQTSDLTVGVAWFVLTLLFLFTWLLAKRLRIRADNARS